MLASDLPPRARLLALVLATYTSPGSVVVWPSAETLGEAMGTSESSARRTIRVLRDAGWVQVETGNSSRSNRYTLSVPADQAADPATSDRVAEQPDPVTSDRVTLPPVAADPATSDSPPDQDQTTEQTTTPQVVESDWSEEVAAAAERISAALTSEDLDRLRREQSGAAAAAVRRLLTGIEQKLDAGWTADGIAQAVTGTGLGDVRCVAAVLAKRVTNLGPATADPARQRAARIAEREAERAQEAAREAAQREAEAAAVRPWRERWDALDVEEQMALARTIAQDHAGVRMMLRSGQPNALLTAAVCGYGVDNGWPDPGPEVAAAA